MQLRATLRLLLGQHAGERAEPWRRSVLRSLRLLTASDRALMVLRTADEVLVYADELGQDAVRAYVNRFAELDRTRVADTVHNLEVWSLNLLWQPDERERSVYYRSFAVPFQCHDTIGATLHFTRPQAEACLLFHRTRPSLAGAVEHRRALLELVLEPMRVGFSMSLRGADLVPQLSSLIDVTGQAIALFGLDGRELRQNPVMQRLLAQEPDRESLQEQIRGVAKSVMSTLANGASGDRARRPDGTRREVATSQAAYRLRGNLVGRTALGHGTAIVVSVDRVAFQVPAPDSIRMRYGLTNRELQVASLLMHRLSNAEIARMLGISPHTARHHTESVLAKLGVRSREEFRRVVMQGTTGEVNPAVPPPSAPPRRSPPRSS